MHVILYPAITTRETLLLEVFRAIWYLSGARDSMSRITVLVSGDAAEVDVDGVLGAAEEHLPEAMDPHIARLSRHWLGKIHLVTDEAALLQLPREPAACVIHTPLTDEQAAFSQRIPRTYGGLEIHACRETILAEAVSYLWGPDALLNSEQDVAARNRAYAKRFREFTDNMSGDAVNICGTGPSLSAALESGFDFSKGNNLVCNSAVTNRELLKKLRPRFIIAGDPVFHCGPSRYAGAFRRDLNAALLELDAILITQPPYVMPLKEALDESLHDRIVAVPLDQRNKPNIDLRDEWRAEATENILTMYLLPVACSVAKTINIFGCDGRSYLENSYFWKHDSKAQYDDLMASAFALHPAFFRRNFDDYLVNHCSALERMMGLAEAKGISIANCSPSYLPPLAKRFNGSAA